MEPQKAIKCLEEILGDLNEDGKFLTSELKDIQKYSKCIHDKIKSIL